MKRNRTTQRFRVGRRLAALLLVALLGWAWAPIGAQQDAEPAAARPDRPLTEHYWKAWIEPRGEGNRLRVEGIVTAGTPGHYTTLRPAEPQGINPRTLLLHLRVEQLPGMWIQVVTDIPACYRTRLDGDQYDHVTIQWVKDGAPAPGVIRTLDIIKPERAPAGGGP